MNKIKKLLYKIHKDNLFLLSSSISYYSAVAIAPFFLILLSLASLIDSDLQFKVIDQVNTFSPEVGVMVEIIFSNLNQGIKLNSISGLIGAGILLFTSSLVFIQLRYSFDVIYGLHINRPRRSFLQTIRQKFFAMFVVIVSGIFLLISSSLPGLIRLFLGTDTKIALYQTMAIITNILVYLSMFFCIHYFSPSEHPRKRDAFLISLISSIFFVIGNLFLGFYFREFATSSIYGAAASLLIFLIWTYYSSYTLFLSAEIYLLFRKLKE